MEMDEHQWHWHSDDSDYCNLRLSWLILSFGLGAVDHHQIGEGSAKM